MRFNLLFSPFPTKEGASGVVCRRKGATTTKAILQSEGTWSREARYNQGIPNAKKKEGTTTECVLFQLTLIIIIFSTISDVSWRKGFDENKTGGSLQNLRHRSGTKLLTDFLWIWGGNISNFHQKFSYPIILETFYNIPSNSTYKLSRNQIDNQLVEKT